MRRVIQWRKLFLEGELKGIAPPPAEMRRPGRETSRIICGTVRAEKWKLMPLPLIHRPPKARREAALVGLLSDSANAGHAVTALVSESTQKLAAVS